MNVLNTSGTHDIKEFILEKWGRLTEQEIAAFNHDRNKFYGYVEEHYLQPRSKIEHEIKNWESTLAA